MLNNLIILSFHYFDKYFIMNVAIMRQYQDSMIRKEVLEGHATCSSFACDANDVKPRELINSIDSNNSMACTESEMIMNKIIHVRSSYRLH